MKILTVVGARPQFIKAAPVSRELRKTHQEVLVHTGQHYDHNMSDVFFEELHIPRPEYNLGVGSGSHGRQTGEMLAGIEEIILREKPDLLLVYGDTNSTLAGALAAGKLHIPVAHVEAGLRSFNRLMPEEINRVLTDHVSDKLFCPTDTAVRNLAREGLTEQVYNTGDVMYDALLYNVKIAEGKSTILQNLNLKSQHYMLATVHRAENTDVPERLKQILLALAAAAKEIILPLHPRTRNKIKDLGLDYILGEAAHITCIEPVGYLDMLMLEKHSAKIITDSGGVQKEAYMLKIPCVTLRDETEWVETIEAGWNTLAGSGIEEITDKIISFWPTAAWTQDVFGDGQAARKIAQLL